MKRIILAVLGFGGLTSAYNSSAQTFTPADKHVKYTVYTSANINANITNTTSSDIQLSWRIYSHDFPADWKSTTGVCDNVTCYTSGVFSGGTNTTIPFSGTMDFHLQLLNFENVSDGTHNVYVELKDGTTTDTVHFEITKWPTSLSKNQKSDNNITLYPNPARSELNVLFDANAGIKNLAVYNLIGKAVSVYRVSGNSAKLDIDNIPSGIYFIRFVDNTGRVVATRKFTHQ